MLLDRQLLGKTVTDGLDNGDMNGTLRYRRRRPDKGRSSSVTNRGDDNQTDGDDEIIESLVKTGKSPLCQFSLCSNHRVPSPQQQKHQLSGPLNASANE